MAFAKIRRPVLISIVCIIGYAWMIIVLPGMFSPSIKRLGDFVPMVYGMILASTFISLIGVWHMKRWGVELYTFSFFVKMAFFTFTDQFGMFEIIGIVFSLFFITSFLVFYKRMDRNL